MHAQVIAKNVLALINKNSDLAVHHSNKTHKGIFMEDMLIFIELNN